MATPGLSYLVLFLNRDVPFQCAFIAVKKKRTPPLSIGQANLSGVNIRETNSAISGGGGEGNDSYKWMVAKQISHHEMKPWL